MDAHDQLLLSEGVCRQLGIITYMRRLRQPEGKLGSMTMPRRPVQWCLLFV